MPKNKEEPYIDIRVYTTINIVGDPCVAIQFGKEDGYTILLGPDDAKDLAQTMIEAADVLAGGSASVH